MGLVKFCKMGIIFVVFFIEYGILCLIVSLVIFWLMVIFEEIYNVFCYFDGGVPCC